MKKILLSFATLLMLVLASCSGKKGDITDSTMAFLDAYFKIDYSLAGTFCTANMAMELKEKLKGIESLDPVVKNLLVSQSKEIKAEIVAVNRLRGSDSAKVNYRIILPKKNQSIEQTLSLVLENKVWRIAELGK